jgi:hypothetical protein
MSSAFGTGPSNGQFWFGGSTFPGFMFKKNLGVGGRRSTKMNPGGNITCNGPTYLYNKYTPGSNGVGASSMSNRRAKNRLATVCRSGDGSNTKNCFPCQSTLGQYSNYTHNPNGYFNCLQLQLPKFSITGEYVYLQSEPGFNTVIKITGESIIFVYIELLVVTSELYINEVYQPPSIIQNATRGQYTIPAGKQQNNQIWKFILKFNI